MQEKKIKKEFGRSKKEATTYFKILSWSYIYEKNLLVSSLH